MRLIKVKKIKKKVWHEVCGGLYDYHETEKEPRFIVELNEEEYLGLIQKEKERKE